MIDQRAAAPLQVEGRKEPLYALAEDVPALLINGLWLETPALAEDAQFVSALARGLRRFKQFLRAQSIDLSAVKTTTAEAKLAKQLKLKLN